MYASNRSNLIRVICIGLLLYPFGVSAQLREVVSWYPSASVTSTGCFAPRCFLYAEALDGGTAVVSNSRGLVTVSVREPSNRWRQQQVIVNPDFTLPSSYTEGERANFPPFASAIALQGDLLLIAGSSAKYNFKDVIYVFTRANGKWTHRQVLALQHPAGVDGTVVTDIDVDGNTVLVSGARYTNDNSTGTTTTYSQVDVYLRQSNGLFGRRAVINPPTGREVPYAGYQLGISGRWALIGDPSAAAGSGRAYLYESTPSGWLLRRTFLAAGAEAGAAFGSSVAINGSTIAISAPEKSTDTPNQFGAIYTFERISNAWQQTSMVTIPESPPVESPVAEPSDGWRFGARMTLDGDRIVVGVGNSNWEVAPLGYLIERRNGVWTAVAELDADNSSVYSRRLTLSGSTLLMGTSDDAYSTQGLIYELPLVGLLP